MIAWALLGDMIAWAMLGEMIAWALLDRYDCICPADG